MVYASGMVTFYAHYSLPRSCGRPRRVGRSLIGNLALHTIAQVHAAYLQVRLKAFQGIDPRERPIEELTYAQFHIAHYRVQCESRQKKSITTDLGRYKHWLEPALGQIPLGQINATLINQQIVKMQVAKLAAATIRNVIGQLSTSLTLAVELGFIAQNPVKNIKLPRVNNQRTVFLSVQQIANFMTAAQRREEIIASRMLMLQGYTGARLGEVTNMKWSDVFLDQSLWKLPTQKSGKPGVIHLSAAAKEVVCEVQVLRRNDYVFPGEKGNDRLSRPIRLFKRICKDAGIEGHFKIHDLRHGWVSTAIDAGVPIEIVSHAARHSSPAVTRAYVHAHANTLLAANETVAKLIAPVTAQSELKAA